ncbi:MAG: ribonuclease P protein component [Patescibacteria group bacterium]|nr:ribonuclease P protein component [Patescibacteria group bacterium]
MLSIKYRLKSKKEFNEVFRRGKTISNDVLLAKYQRDNFGNLKIGFSVGVKFSKKASERNRAKRWLREAVRSMIEKIAPGHKIIFLINSKFSYEQMSCSLVKDKIEDLLGKAKLLK